MEENVSMNTKWVQVLHHSFNPCPLLSLSTYPLPFSTRRIERFWTWFEGRKKWISAWGTIEGEVSFSLKEFLFRRSRKDFKVAKIWWKVPPRSLNGNGNRQIDERNWRKRTGHSSYPFLFSWEESQWTHHSFFPVVIPSHSLASYFSPLTHSLSIHLSQNLLPSRFLLSSSNWSITTLILDSSKDSTLPILFPWFVLLPFYSFFLSFPFSSFPSNNFWGRKRKPSCDSTSSFGILLNFFPFVMEIMMMIEGEERKWEEWKEKEMRRR